MSRPQNIFFIFLLFISAISHAQFYTVGQDPALIKWKVIKTEHFKVIFPEGIESQAQHIANGFELVYEPLSADMKIKPVKIPVLLHNHTVLSNAEVPWAPKRIEFFMCPGQDDYAQPWTDQLMLHEFRHVVQYSKINQGLTKVLSYILGQQITAGVIGTFVPLWFVEGDAVYSETAFSKSGRGRTPQFSMKMRAQVLEKGIYNYNKACFGSYRTFTPDRYEFGYQLVSAARKHYSGEIWEKALDKTAKLPIMVVPFNHGIKKVSGMSKVKLYKYCFNELDSLWGKQPSLTKLSEATPIVTKIWKLYTNYNFFHFYDNNSSVGVRSGMNDIIRFIRIDSGGKEHRLFTPGSYASTSFSASAGKLVWAETTYDPRWENRTWSVIKVYDINRRQVRQLTHRTRYFAPNLDRQGKKIVCVEQGITNHSALVVLSAENGKILQRFEADSSDFLMTPSWSEAGHEIVFIALNRFGKRICLIDSAGNFKNMTAPGFTEVRQPLKSKNFVYYVAAYSGIDNIYALDVVSGKTYQLTSSLYGVSDPSISASGNELIYADYTSDGFKPVTCKIDSAHWIPIKNQTECSGNIFLQADTNKIIDFYNNNKKNYPAKHYSKFLHLFNFHSWGPISVDVDNTTIKPGVELLSQNDLSSMYFSAGYVHEWSKPMSMLFAQFSYRGWYPRIDVTFEYHFNRSDTITWNVLALQAGLKVPLTLTKGKYYIFIEPQVNYNIYNLIPKKKYPFDAFSGYYQAMEYDLWGYNLIKTSLRDINPRWGQVLDITYRHTPFSGAQIGSITALQAIVYFPGIGRHHSLSIYAGYQHKSGKEYIFGDIVSPPHGLEYQTYKKICTLKGAYQMPLFYPDWSIGSLLYIKRFRASLYYDYAHMTDKNNKHAYMNSAGLALIADLHFLRFLAPISIGVRATYRFDNSPVLAEFLYSVNFDQLRFRRSLAGTIY